MFQTVPRSIIRSFSLYTQQWYMSYRFAESLRAGSGQKLVPCNIRKFQGYLRRCSNSLRARQSGDRILAGV